MSIRPGWFYHASEDEKVRSLEALKEIYFASVGSNSVLLLNVPPDRRGRIHENDARRLHEFGEWLRRSFARNLAAGGDTLWTARAGEAREFDVKDGPFDAVMLQEEIAKGQRVERFRIEVSDDGRTWETAAEGTTIGYKRIVRLPEARTTRKLRVTIDGTRAPARISHVGLYLTE